MSDTAMLPRNSGDRGPVLPPVVDQELADQLLARAQAEGIELLGPDGLLSQVTKAVLERALAEEMTEHLGYEKHDPAGRGSGNSRNGVTGKTLLTDIGGVELAVPRDRNGSFDPQIVRKGQTRLDVFNQRIIALYTSGTQRQQCPEAAALIAGEALCGLELVSRRGTDVALCRCIGAVPGSAPDLTTTTRYVPRGAGQANKEPGGRHDPGWCVHRSGPGGNAATAE
jgi:Transposase, Mutator family